MPVRFSLRWSVFLAVIGLAAAPQAAQAQATVKDILERPYVKWDVTFDIPTAAEIPNCKLEVERGTNASGWVLTGPNGQTLRRFLDTNKDGNVDEYRYYQHGIEVFREIDTNIKTPPVDQVRWMNMGGTKWGVDRNEDGKVDLWRNISAEEATREAVMALVNKDEQRLAAVLITPEEIAQVGIQGDSAKALTDRVQQAGQTFRTVIAAGKAVTAKTQWTRFDCSMLMPSLIPAEQGKTKNDLLVYENVMAIIDNSGQSGFLHVGEMILVGNCWKLTQVPRPLDGETIQTENVLLQPVIAGAAQGDGLSEKMRDLIDKLKALDNAAPVQTSPKADFEKYNVARAGLLAELTKEAGTDDEKTLWIRQRIELISTATQTNTYPNGLAELARTEAAIKQTNNADLIAFITLQRMGVEHDLKLLGAKEEDYAKIQDDWKAALQQFIKDHQRSPDAGQAVFELARLLETSGDGPQAQQWYEAFTKNYSQGSFVDAAKVDRAKGAVRRMKLKGTPLRLTGKVFNSNATLDTAAAPYKGKVLAIVFWATWCQPCTQDLPQIQALYKQHRAEGFEVIGVNLDAPGPEIAAYIQAQKVEWPHIHEPGAQDSRPALEFGIITLPTMILVNRQGVVTNAGATVGDLKTDVPLLLKP